MNNIQLCYEKLSNHLDNITLYAQSIEIQRSVISELQQMEDKSQRIYENSLEYSEIMKKVILTPIQYNALIISIYGCFESFVHELFKNYVVELCNRHRKYSLLPDVLKDKHLKKVGDFLSNPQRFKNFNLTQEQAINNIHNLMNDGNKIEFAENLELVLHHSANMKIEQIIDLSKEMGIENLRNKIVQNPKFQKDYIDNFNETESTYESLLALDSKTIFASLDLLVNERNNVAHGWAENRRSISDIKVIIVYIDFLCSALSGILMEEIVKMDYETGKMFELGKPEQVVDRHIICYSASKCAIAVNDYIVAVKNTNIKLLRVETLQLNRKPVSIIDIPNVGIGIGFEKFKKNKIDDTYTFYCYNRKFVT